MIKPLIFGISAAVSSLNPFLVSGIETYEITGQVFESLAKINPWTGELEPSLAKSWTMDPKKKLVHVELRPNVKFHNGEDFTAADVLFSYQAYQDPDFKGEVWRAMWSDLKGVSVKGPLKLDLEMSDLTYQGFKNVMTALRILPKSFYGKRDFDSWFSQAVGTGPYVVQKFAANKFVELKANDNWWGGKLDPLTVKVKTVSDLSLARQMLKKGELDFFEIPSSMPHESTDTSYPSAFAHGFGLTVNMRRPALKKLAVRKALLKLWNRDSLNRKIYGGEMNLSLDAFSPHTPFYPKGEPVGYDLKESARLLKSAGLKDGIELKVLVSEHNADRWLGLYQSDAAKAGVKILIEKVSSESEWWKLQNEAKFDLLAYDGPLGSIPNEPVYHSGGSYNSGGISDSELDNDLDKIRGEFSEVKRSHLNQKMILRVRNLQVDIPGLTSNKVYYLISNRLKVDQKFPKDLSRWRVVGEGR